MSCSKVGAVQSVSYLSSGRSLPRDNLSSRVLSVGGLDRRRNVVTQSYAAPPASICPFDETSAVQNRTRTTEEKIGVLLLNLGGPESLNDDIIRLPRLFQFLQRPLAQLISTLRAPKSKEGYAAIGGGSPLRKITDEQAYAIKDALQAKDIKKDRITKLVVLPLYPQFSISTTGSSLRVLQSIFREDAYLSRLPVSIIQSWYQRQGYVKSMADLIEEELQTFSKPDEVMVFFSAHGVPVSYVEEAGDPYRDQMEDCIYLIMQELKARGVYNDHTLAYQSRVGPVQWLKPYTDEVLVELGKKGVKSLLAVPVSFVSEHIETLEEIDMEYRELALESGIENWGRVPALGCTTSFITDLADAVVEALPSAKAIVTSSDSAEEADDYDPFRYAIKLLFGSVVAFLLLFSPKMFVAFRKQLL
ncbi:Ferrochelatase-2, chloroplastic [Linum perenne]